MIDTILQLNGYDRQNYFHGSHVKDLKVINPMRSYNVVSQDDFTNGLAVFAADNYQEACAYALLDLSKVPVKYKLEKGVSVEPYEKGIILKIPKEWYEFMKSNVGYIYVVPVTPFQRRLGTNVRSDVSVEVIDSIKVDFIDFKEMGGKVKFI